MSFASLVEPEPHESWSEEESSEELLVVGEAVASAPALRRRLVSECSPTLPTLSRHRCCFF